MQKLSAKEKGLEMKLQDFNFRIWNPIGKEQTEEVNDDLCES